MDKTTCSKLICDVLYGHHKKYPDDILNGCIKEFDNNIRQLEEELACKKQTLIDLRTERARRDINKKFGLKIGEPEKTCVYTDTDIANWLLQEVHKNDG